MTHLNKINKAMISAGLAKKALVEKNEETQKAVKDYLLAEGWSVHINGSGINQGMNFYTKGDHKSKLLEEAFYIQSGMCNKIYLEV